MDIDVNKKCLEFLQRIEKKSTSDLNYIHNKSLIQDMSSYNPVVEKLTEDLKVIEYLKSCLDIDNLEEQKLNKDIPEKPVEKKVSVDVLDLQNVKIKLSSNQIQCIESIYKSIDSIKKIKDYWIDASTTTEVFVFNFDEEITTDEIISFNKELSVSSCNNFFDMKQGVKLNMNNSVIIVLLLNKFLLHEK